VEYLDFSARLASLMYNPTLETRLSPTSHGDSMTIPAYETIDHFGVTVPDLDAAVEFFIETLGAELWYQEGPFEDPDGDSMWLEMRIHPRTIERLAMLRLGSTATIELLEFSRNGDTDRDAQDLTHHSAAHIGLRVSNIDKAMEHLRAAEEVEVLSGPTTVESGVAAGLRWVFFLTPWGLLMELVEFPPGMSI
jgi:catechol 2,3-dioxygenase-like lactoylglutathione lyase family enzyme